MAETSTTLRLIEDFVRVDPVQVENLLDRYPTPLAAIQALSNRRHRMYVERAKGITSYDIDLDRSDPWVQEMALICAATRQAWNRRRRELKGKDASPVEPRRKGEPQHQEGSGALHRGVGRQGAGNSLLRQQGGGGALQELSGAAEGHQEAVDLSLVRAA